MAQMEAPMNEEYQLSSHCWLNYFHQIEQPFETSHHYTELTGEQQELFTSFRTSFQREYETTTRFDRSKLHTVPDNYTLLRYLQADKYDPKLALERIISSIEWRQKIDLYGLVSKPYAPLELYRKLRVREFAGYAKNGMPVFIERIGAFMASIGTSKTKSLEPEHYLKCYIYTMGQLIQRFRENANDPKHSTWKMYFLGDFKGIGLKAAYRSVGLVKQLAKDVEVHFPEMAGPIILFNVPSIVSGAYSMLKPFLDPVIVNKIQMFSYVPTKELLQIMDESVLFKEYGGKNSNPFPNVDY